MAETQKQTSIWKMAIGLQESVSKESVKLLTTVLADTIVLRDMYKKHHWQVTGPNFYSLHLLFDKHFKEQVELVDALAERIQLLGGVAIAMADDVLKHTNIGSIPSGREKPEIQLKRLQDAHEILIQGVRKAAEKTAKNGDDGSNDLLVSQVLTTNEFQSWFITSHLQ